MTFKELMKQTYLECDAGVTYKQVEKIVVTMFRIATEEFVIHPETAYVDINDLFRFYLRQIRITKDKNKDSRGRYVRKDEKPGIKWELGMTTHASLKRLLKGETNILNFKICNIPFYPDNETMIRKNNVTLARQTYLDIRIQQEEERNTKPPRKRNVNILKRLPEADDEEE